MGSRIHNGSNAREREREEGEARGRGGEGKYAPVYSTGGCFGLGARGLSWTSSHCHVDPRTVGVFGLLAPRLGTMICLDSGKEDKVAPVPSNASWRHAPPASPPGPAHWTAQMRAARAAPAR